MDPVRMFWISRLCYVQPTSKRTAAAFTHWSFWAFIPFPESQRKESSHKARNTSAQKNMLDKKRGRRRILCSINRRPSLFIPSWNRFRPRSNTRIRTHHSITKKFSFSRRSNQYDRNGSLIHYSHCN